MDLTTFHAGARVVIAAPPEEIYAFIADMPRMGEISPQCTGGRWESESRGVGAIFIGSNTAGDRTWQRRIRVAVVDPAREYAWENWSDPAAPASEDDIPVARWGYTFAPVEGGTKVDETWRLLNNPRLEDLGEETLRQIQARNQTGMEQTLAKLKELLET